MPQDNPLEELRKEWREVKTSRGFQCMRNFLFPKVKWTKNNFPQIIGDILHSPLFQIFLCCILFVLAYVKAVSVAVALAIAIAWFVTVYGVARYKLVKDSSAATRLTGEGTA